MPPGYAIRFRLCRINGGRVSGRRAVAQFDGLLRGNGNRRSMPQALEPRRRTAVIAIGFVSPRLRVSMAVAVCAMASLFFAPGSLYAQVAFPAPLPGQTAAPPPAGSASPFPPIGGSAPIAAPAFPSGGVAPMGSGFSQGPPQGGPPADQQKCLNDFTPLKQEAEKRAAVIKGLGQRKAPPSEACKAIGAFSQSELKMIKFIETNSQKCGIPPQVAQQMNAGHKGTESMLAKVCAVAQQQAQGGGGGGAPSLSEALGTSSSLPEAAPTKRSGGSTFDTLNGNVLTR